MYPIITEKYLTTQVLKKRNAIKFLGVYIKNSSLQLYGIQKKYWKCIMIYLLDVGPWL